jgi:hypothetical protein
MNKADSLDKETSEGTAISESKRALLRSAWVAPVVIAVTLPKSGYAANISSSGRPSEGGDSKPKSDNGNHFGQLKKNP